MEKNKKKNYFFIIILFLFIFFASLYSSNINGYYEYSQYKKTILTNKAIETFENDLTEGNEINSDKYIDKKYKDYSNGISKIGLKVSTSIEKLFTKGIKKTFHYLSKLVLD